MVVGVLGVVGAFGGCVVDICAVVVGLVVGIRWVIGWRWWWWCNCVHVVYVGFIIYVWWYVGYLAFSIGGCVKGGWFCVFDGWCRVVVVG